MSNPLVSIVIISYNASKTIIETLESIKLQTYSPLELIIADDHSTDDTALKCEKWLAENNTRFVNYKLIVNEENRGNSANVNIGIQASSGEWVKGLGDDVLLADTIEKNVRFVIKNRCDIVVSKVQPFVDETKERLGIIPADDYLFPASNHDQYIAFIKDKLDCPSPTWFFSRDLYNRIGGYDERFRFSDDVPFAYKILESGYFFTYLPEVTVYYRIKNTSLSNSKSLTGKQKQLFFESRSLVYQKLQAPALRKNRLYGTLIRKNMLYFLYKKKIHSRDDSIARYFYGALFTIVRMFN